MSDPLVQLRITIIGSRGTVRFGSTTDGARFTAKTIAYGKWIHASATLEAAIDTLYRKFIGVREQRGSRSLKEKK